MYRVLTATVPRGPDQCPSMIDHGTAAPMAGMRYARSAHRNRDPRKAGASGSTKRRVEAERDDSIARYRATSSAVRLAVRIRPILHRGNPETPSAPHPLSIYDTLENVPVSEPARPFEQPTRFERLLNRAVGALVRFGIGLPHMRLLEVRGRKSGKLSALPVDLLTEQGKLFLVAPRGYTQWVRNAEASGEVTLRRGKTVERYRLRALTDAEKPPILKAYLDSFRREVQRYFPIAAGSPAEQFASFASRYPAYELIRVPE
jgi:deazaflavin-dependent oxidoreductase (nitroreductase family)